ncbi:MAG: hypothetical protein HYT77_06395 [Deltaproteobacteria bacterium]|nr:hypothetical protein [Deltaproteobacteria bacterium]
MTFTGTFTPPTAGAVGGECTTERPCASGSGLVCVQGRCVTPGSGAGSEICGDLLCNGSESPTNCPSDCGSVAGGGGYCGDGTCQAARGETTTTCASDCSSQQQQQQSVNLPSTFTVTRGAISASTCSFLDVSDAGGTDSMTISSQSGSGFSASLPISDPLFESYNVTVPLMGIIDTTTGGGTKSSMTWSVSTSRSYTSGAGCTFTYVQGLQGNLSPFSCTAFVETLTVAAEDELNDCDGVPGIGIGDNELGTSCTVTYGSATCSQ